jgi:lipopolysaccharide biosynthesis protein
VNPVQPGARVFAFYLPQFHPIPENDEWWGRGFTEWTNAARAKPLFRGHYQPHVPADLGFYDLRVPEVRAAQAALAREYGVEAFCYYYYWFAGKRLLERPFDEVLNSGEPDLPFCLCWANATWTGVWHGEPNRILVEQTYPGKEDAAAHFERLLPAFRDPRYATVDGKPVYVVHRPLDIPEARAVMDSFRAMAKRAGLAGLHLVGVTPHKVWSPRDYGFDALVIQRMPALDRAIPWRHPVTKLKAWMGGHTLTVRQYREYIDRLMTPHVSELEYYPCLLPNWDNTPRSGMNGLVLDGSTPELFRQHVRDALRRIRSKPREHRLVFLKSWNEWAEGNYVEPDLRFGRGYLEALRGELLEDAIGSARPAQPEATSAAQQTGASRELPADPAKRHAAVP